MKRNFQSLVVLYQILILASWVVQSITDAWLPPEMRSFLGLDRSVLSEEAGGMPEGSFGMGSALWALTLASLLASVGLILFRRWGRTLFVLTAAAGLSLMPFGGLYVNDGWTVLVGSAAGVVEGMITALVYYSPLRKLFRSGGI